MCGILGIVNTDSAPIDKEVLKRGLRILAHRGPDDEGVYISNRDPGEKGSARKPSVGLGHRRLSIIDLSQAGHQPMSNEDGSIWIVLNGEIYNYIELGKELRAKGHVFKSNSDTEVIIHLYEEYGQDCVTRFRGMFAFAIWDSANELLFLARDRLGKKPLFYTVNDQGIIFSSEIKPILSCRGSAPGANYRGLFQYLNYFYIPAPETAFEGIKKLPPAHILTFKAGKTTISKYWELDYSSKFTGSFNEASDRIKELFRESVKIRMISDVPLGVFASGGLDSSIVAAVMASVKGGPIKSYSVGFRYEELNELPYSRIVATQLRSDHHELVMEHDAIKYLPELIENFGEPHADSSALPTYMLSRMAKNDISVTLVGEGSDELFAGYSRYRLYKILRYLQFLPSCLKDKLGISIAARYKRWIGVFFDDLKNELFQKEFAVKNKALDPDAELSGIVRRSQKFKGVDPCLYIDSMFFLPNDLLSKIDISTMSHGLEARAPFLDHKFVEFAASLPGNWKLHGSTPKFILKEAFKDLLPGQIVERKKAGFIVPVDHWFRNELKDYARAILLSQKALSRGYFNKPRLVRLLDDHAQGKADHGRQIWTLLVLELWHNIFIDNAVSLAAA